MTVGRFQHIGELKVTGNMLIQNFDSKKEMDGDFYSKVIFTDGKAKYYRNDEGGIFKRDGRDSFLFDSKTAILLKELAKLDGKNDLSINDLKKAKNLKGLVLGQIENNLYGNLERVKKVDMSGIDSGEVTLTTTSGLVLHVNVETAKEAEAIKAKKEAKDEKYNLSNEKYRAAGERGREMQDCLHGYTTDGDWREFEEYVNETDAGNVLQTLRGFEYEACDDSKIWNSERFFQQLFTENRSNDQKSKVAQQIINNVIEYINENEVDIADATIKKTLDEIKTSLKNTNLTNNMTNSIGKLLDDKMHQLFEIFKIEYKY